MKPSLSLTRLSTLLALLLLLSPVVVAHAEGPQDMQGWEIDAPYNQLYDARELDSFKGSVKKIYTLVPMPGMAPATAIVVANMVGTGVFTTSGYILQEVARRADVDEDLVRILDEHISRIDKRWWEALTHKDTFSHEDYYKHLVKTVFSISLRGGVIIGRGANLILGPDRAFRVRIVGSPLQCAERVAERENISLEEALQQVHDVDQERAEYTRRLYDADIDDPMSYDLVLNSDRYDQAQLVELILQAMQKSGYKLKNDVFDSLAKLA